MLAVGMALAAGCGQGAPPGEPDGGPAKAAAPEQPAFETTFQRVLMLEEGGRFTEALRLCQEMEATFAKHPDRGKLAEARSRLMDEKREGLALANTINALGSGSAAETKEARARLAEAGEAGAVLLRKAVQERSDQGAAEAARLLAEKKDRKTARLLAARLREPAPEPLRSAALDGLKALTAEDPDGTALRDLLAALGDNKDVQKAAVAEYLAWVLQTRCGGSAARFNALLQDPQADGKLKAYIDAARTAGTISVSTSGETRSFAAPQRQPGLRGQYFADVAFTKPAFERLDTCVAIPDKSRYGYPDGRQDFLSIRWTGEVAAGKTGEYVFYVSADDGMRLWIDGRQVIDEWNIRLAVEKQARVTLTKGLHALRLDYFQSDGPGSVSLSWSGPGFAKGPLTDKAVSTLPGEPGR